ncbi:glycosyltransferase family 4 protein [Microbacterium panaciterrae]|uniref:D-inositol 3-phosphate glycosyltransferase n=1 Tax=Microbacterium panaciterrae TaxID=985759 RepID=A0ABP8PGW2_9MICO
MSESSAALDPTRVLVVCDLIAPGGGPTGYTYNLRAALARTDSPDVDVRFAGLVLEQRNRATGEPRPAPARTRRTPSIRRIVGRIRHEIGHALKSGMTPRLRAQIAAADVVVFQGFQDPRRLRFARSRGKATWYMPHSPTLSGDEFAMMNAGRAPGKVARTRRRMIRDERALFRLADRVVFPTWGAAGVYVDAFGGILATTPTRYVLSGVPRPVLRETAGDDGDADPAILFVGRYVAHKGYDLFLAAAEALAAERPDLRFCTLGAGPDRRASDAVHDLGWLDDPTPAIARARFLVIPNRTAYFDLLPLEAAALGKGLVFTAVGGNVDQQALLPDSVLCAPSELAAGIEQGIELSADPAWGHANAAAYEQVFTDERMAERWLALFREWRSERGAERRALWLVPVAPIGGVARHVLDATRAGIPGWRITVLCPEGALAERLRAQDTPVITGAFGPDAGFVASRRTVAEAVRATDPEVVHSHLAYADIVSAWTRLPRTARRFTTEHGIALDDGVYHRSSAQARLMALVHRERFRRFAGAIAVSRATRDAMIAKWRVRRPVVVIPNGVDAPEQPRTPAAGTDRTTAPGLRILSLSRLSAEKRIDRLIEAFARLHAAHPEATLTVAGEGPQRDELVALADRLGVPVDFPGFVDPEAAMAGADVIAQLSVWENCSYTLLDAVARGLRVVASDVGGNGDIVGPERCVDPDDRAATAAALAGARRVPRDRLTTPGDMTAAIGRAYRPAGEEARC